MLVKSIFVQMCKAYSVYDCKLTVTSLCTLLDLYHNVRVNLILHCIYASAHRKHPDSSWPATRVSYNAVLIWLLQVRVPLRVLWGYFTATGWAVAPVTVASEYLLSTRRGTLTCSSHSCTSLCETQVAGQRNVSVYELARTHNDHEIALMSLPTWDRTQCKKFWLYKYK